MANNNNGNQMKQAASDALSYFAIVANTEQSEARREFSRKAGGWIADAVEKLGGNEIVIRNADAQKRKDILEIQYELASGALHSQNSFTDIIREATKIGESDYRGGWNTLKETLRGRMDDALRLASDLDSLYLRQNEMLLEFAESELIDAAAGGEEEIDKRYVGLVLNYLGAAKAKVAQPAQMAWGNDIMKNGPIYDRMEPDFTKSAEVYAQKLNNILMKNTAIYSAITGVLVAGKKVTKEEFMSNIEEHESNMSAQISSVLKQMEDAMKNPQSLGEQSEYDGSMFG